MAFRTHVVSAALLMAAGLGCDTWDSQDPIAPSAPLPRRAHVVTDVTLSGVVYEAETEIPIEGVRVRSSDHIWTTTDAKGFFRLRPVWVCPCLDYRWVDAGITRLTLEKEGYGDPVGVPASIFFPGQEPQPGSRDIAIDGDTRIVIELVRQDRSSKGSVR